MLCDKMDFSAIRWLFLLIMRLPKRGTCLRVDRLGLPTRRVGAHSTNGWDRAGFSGLGRKHTHCSHPKIFLKNNVLTERGNTNTLYLNKAVIPLNSKRRLTMAKTNQRSRGYLRLLEQQELEKTIGGEDEYPPPPHYMCCCQNGPAQPGIAPPCCPTTLSSLGAFVVLTYCSSPTPTSLICHYYPQVLPPLEITCRNPPV